MAIDIFWRIPTHGEPSSLRNKLHHRGDWSQQEGDHIVHRGLAGGGSDGFNSLDYIAEVARAAEISGFHGGLIPSFPMTDEPWAISSFLARETSTFRFMIAFQPGFLNPVTAARMTASLQRASNGRALFNIITGGGGPAQLWWGDVAPHDDRYARTTEFLDVLRGLWKGGSYSHHGKFYQLENAALPEQLLGQDFPEIYFSGSSDAALVSASQHADFYLSWLEPFDQLKEKFDKVKEKTDKLGRKVKCAVRVDIVARATEEEAWREVRRGFENLSEADKERYARFAQQTGDSVGANRQRNNTPKTLDNYRDFILHPNIWSGFSLLRGGQTNGIVGSYEQVAERLDDLVKLGADAFILASTPHLEEAYRVGEEVLPLVQGHGARNSILRAVG
ncbi:MULTISPECIES: LLM class flavin-dependent oxidoreductase [Methylovorus]|jgi:alkanesulfonate monooxygenase|uniref:LLM class flavin-dependent oxidoreductase n=1 Tax=Methylovorus TaxID=81682 RepID=UPI0001EC4397|nr:MULTISPECIES: LLM class flavin-dependent oxidoreductase [Methylovorus]ADQ83331.1 Alkanesulfonate monooxygenase [Methylovorus sp. MP688]KAF0835999.1 alkanesulfonate monooxygenase [Methylovorus glucosotrophus]